MGLAQGWDHGEVGAGFFVGWVLAEGLDEGEVGDLGVDGVGSWWCELKIVIVGW